MSGERTITAFCVAPLLVPLGTAIFFRDPQAAPVVIGSILSAYTGMLILGVPTFLVLRRIGWNSFWWAPPIGFLYGAFWWVCTLVGFGLLLGLPLELAIQTTMKTAMKGQPTVWPLAGLFGMVVAGTFWLIARPR